MTTLNISLPDSMRVFIKQEVTKGGYSTAITATHWWKEEQEEGRSPWVPTP